MREEIRKQEKEAAQKSSGPAPDTSNRPVDQLAAQSLASQQQMASDIATLRAAERDIFDKISSAPPPRPGG